MNDTYRYAFLSLVLVACSAHESAGSPSSSADASAEAGTRDADGGADSATPSSANDPTSTRVSGAVHGHELVPADTRALFATDSINGRSAPSVTIYVSDYAPFCNGGIKANGTFLRLHVSTEQAAVHVGAYPVTAFGSAPGTDQASSDFGSLDGGCKPLFPTAYGASGTIEITSTTESEVRGRFDVTFESGDSVKGTFVAPTACSSAPSERVCVP
jgi:hypothetical protein